MRKLSDEKTHFGIHLAVILYPNNRLMVAASRWRSAEAKTRATGSLDFV
jgi:hypothetical protein